eukprot:3706187-Pyramimonas_sp.AAC.2
MCIRTRHGPRRLRHRGGRNGRVCWEGGDGGEVEGMDEGVASRQEGEDGGDDDEGEGCVRKWVRKVGPRRRMTMRLAEGFGCKVEG